MNKATPALLALLAVSACQGQTVSQGDRDHALSALHATRKLFLDNTAGLSPAQWNYKPAAGGWSIAEVAEHLAVTEPGIQALVAKSLAGPAQPEKVQARPRALDEKLIATLPVRDKKFQAPEMFKPSGRFKSPAEMVEAFKAAREKSITYVRETKDSLRDHFAPHPVFGDLDGLQWYILIAGHTERHVNQILEVKADPGFPKK